MTEATTLALAGGLLTMEAQPGSEIAERKPAYDIVMLPDEREVHVTAKVIRGPDELFVPDVAMEHTVGKLGLIVQQEGDFYRDVLLARSPQAAGGREGKVFLRFDRYREHTLRAVMVSPGRYDDESEASRAETDEIALRLAKSIRFAESATPLDLVAAESGVALVHLNDALLFNLPGGWSCREVYMTDVDDREADNPVLFRGELCCKSPDKRFRIDAYIAIATTEPEAAARPGIAAVEFVLAACKDRCAEDKAFDGDIEIADFASGPHASGVIRTDPYEAKRHQLLRVHAFVGPERFIYVEFNVSGPKWRSRLEDVATLNEIDSLLSNAQPWHPQLAQILAAESEMSGGEAAGATGVRPGQIDNNQAKDSRAKDYQAGEGRAADDCNGDDRDTWIGLGLDMVRLPHPEGWTWVSASPFGGSFTSPAGQRLDVTVESRFDPAALSDPARLAEYATEDGYDTQLPRDADVFANYHILIPGDEDAGGALPGGAVILKSLERQGETNIRILRIEVPLPDAPDLDVADLDVADLEMAGPDADNPDIADPAADNPDIADPDADDPDADNPAGAVEAAMVLLFRADWAPTATPFDRIAPSAEAQLVTLGDWIWFQLPADWKLIPGDARNASADDPDGTETVWISGELLSGPFHKVSPADLERFPDPTHLDSWTNPPGEPSTEWLGERDYLTTVEGEDEDEAGPLRRSHHLRVVAMENHCAILQFNHLTARDLNDERRAWTKRFIRDALASAVVLPERG